MTESKIHHEVESQVNSAQSPFVESESNFDQENEQAWLEQNGFAPVKAGTYHSKERKEYYYHKFNTEVATREEAQAAKTILRAMVEKGILHPKSKIGIIKSQNGFRIVATMPEMIPVDATAVSTPAEQRPDALKKFYDHQRFVSEIGPTDNKFDYALQLLEHDTHITDWLKRIKPDFDANDQSEESILTTEIVDIAEASEFDNWGYDSETQILYPVDFEVVKPAIHIDKDKKEKVAEMILR